MGLTFDKILVILVIAMFVVGPDRLPMYAKRLGELVRSVKRMSEGAKDRLKEEMGPEYDEVDWRQLDPRQYDPRRIIRDALLEDEREARIAERRAARSPASSSTEGAAGAAAAAGAAVVAGSAAAASTQAGGEAGLAFDEEAT